ncbi:hypothetical protein KC19_9G135800 [Ceratodon purpureus]|uniref:TF-B3 domain-containing protein n=1 Tax=Ceratodon purpureus TaxID=3225 RepID=A0A8T0GX47_CERPU|nr:hypothetical protein KC19_9G135800 [Ceratodon purpureus]KAG0562308.1 hypothetical protein KC19_9G135800 [Ceratodon purpureus]KAG0562309.1 hypothetical protein KC19_9G135800 [Ceratodon purpureus]
MDKHFQACAVCTSTCFKEHGSEQPRTYSRPPCFLLPKIDVWKDWTPIPKDFVDAHGDALRGMARIVDSNGKEWTVEIGGSGKHLGFEGGWKNFLANMNLKRGEQMLFALVCSRLLFVQVFNTLGVEVVPPAPVVAAAAPATGKRKRPEVKAELMSDDESDDDDDDGSSDSDMSEYEASKSDAEDVSESDADASPRVVDEELDVSKPRKRVKRKFTGPKAVTTAKPASYKKKVKEGVYIEPGSCTTTYESRRREVTKAELDRAMERAKALKTKFPSIPVHMMPSHVYRGFWLTIPGKFSKEFMPQGKLEVKLKDEHGFEWPATWIRSEKHTGLSGGWAAFSKDHRLEEGDVCVFEVVNSNVWTIVVHIFRVVEVESKPGARGGWEKTYNIVHGALMHQPGVAKKFKSRASTGVKNRTTSTGKKSSTVKSRRKALSESGSDGCDGDDDDVPLTKLYCPNSDVTSEEVDVKPKIISMGPIPKLAKVKQVKQEPGVAPVKRDCDLKPTMEDLKASLNQASSGITRASASVKPEPMDTSEPVGRMWHRVVKVVNKRQSPVSPTLLEILVNLGPRVICSSSSGSAKEDGNGNWWVPRSQFSPDCTHCYID